VQNNLEYYFGEPRDFPAQSSHQINGNALIKLRKEQLKIMTIISLPLTEKVVYLTKLIPIIINQFK